MYAVYERIEQFSLAELPAAFALKLNNASGMTMLVLDKTRVDLQRILTEITPWFHMDYYHVSQERNYRGIAPLVFAEELTLAASNFFPNEYRLFCFHGRVEFIEYEFMPSELDGEVYVNRDWKLLPVWYAGHPMTTNIPRPGNARVERSRQPSGWQRGLILFAWILYDLDDDGRAGIWGDDEHSPWGGLVRFEPAGCGRDAGVLTGSRFRARDAGAVSTGQFRLARASRRW